MTATRPPDSLHVLAAQTSRVVDIGLRGSAERAGEKAGPVTGQVARSSPSIVLNSFEGLHSRFTGAGSTMWCNFGHSIPTRVKDGQRDEPYSRYCDAPNNRPAVGLWGIKSRLAHLSPSLSLSLFNSYCRRPAPNVYSYYCERRTSCRRSAWAFLPPLPLKLYSSPCQQLSLHTLRLTRQIHDCRTANLRI